jgi:hypothetical protein
MEQFIESPPSSGTSVVPIVVSNTEGQGVLCWLKFTVLVTSVYTVHSTQEPRSVPYGAMEQFIVTPPTLL